MADLQLRDLTDGYRLVACCPCGYRADVSPAAIIAAIEGAQYWTLGELAGRLKCKRCRKRLLADVAGAPSAALIRQRLALERTARQTVAFQGGMLFTRR